MVPPIHERLVKVMRQRRKLLNRRVILPARVHAVVISPRPAAVAKPRESMARRRGRHDAAFAEAIR
jgi:hypothetical protein